jgi:hypothetical protein
VTSAEFDRLLKCGEDPLLDWKRDLPANLYSLNPAVRDADRGTLLKDLAAVANSGTTAETGHIVFGAKDLGARRQVFGITGQLDDADLQTWASNVFEVPPIIVYSELIYQSSRLGVLTVRRHSHAPVIPKRTIGSLAEGQVWYRQGSKNTIALTAKLAAYFASPEPYRTSSLEDAALSQAMKYYRDLGDDPHLKLFTERDGLLLKGWRDAYLPGTNRQILIVTWKGEVEHIAMLAPST